MTTPPSLAATPRIAVIPFSIIAGSKRLDAAYHIARASIAARLPGITASMTASEAIAALWDLPLDALRALTPLLFGSATFTLDTIRRAIATDPFVAYALASEPAALAQATANQEVLRTKAEHRIADIAVFAARSRREQTT